MTAPVTTEAQELQRHAAMVRGLVRALVHDAGEADDLEQQVWLAALQREPRPGWPWPAWASGVVRRWRHKFRREATRRARREAVAARLEAQPGAAEVAAQLEAAQRLFAAIQSLEEPWRTTITMRFLDGLPPRAIARRLVIPVATVHSRVRRGLERLRALLGGDDPGGWLAAVVPLLGAPGVHSFGGVVLMSTKIKASAALAAGAFLLGWWAWPARTGGTAADAAAGVVAEEVAPASRTGPETGAAASQPLARVAVSGQADWTVQGQTVDSQSIPVPRASVHAELFEGYEAAGTPRVAMDLRSDERGAFQWALPAPAGAVLLRLRGAASGHVGRATEVLVTPGDPAPQDVEVSLVRLQARIVGCVVDSAGTPLPGATVQLQGAMYECVARTDAEGRYTLAVPARGLVRAVAAADGHARQRGQIAVTAGRDARLDFRLPEPAVLRGVVRDEQGQPIAGASVVSPGSYEFPATSDANGAYVLAGLDPEDRRADSVWVRARGFIGQSVRVSLRRGTIEQDVTLPRGARLSGVVLGDGGRPLLGARLRFVRARLQPGEQEAFGYGASWGDGCTFEDAQGLWQARPIDEQLPVGAVLGVEIVAEGHAPTVAEHVVVRPPGDPERTVIRLHSAAEVRGRVLLAEGGAPLAGAQVSLLQEGARRLDRDATDSVRTDAAGEFTIRDVAAGGASLRVEHPEWPTLEDGPFTVPGPGSSVTRTVRVQSGGTLTGRVLDPKGAPVPDAELRLGFWRGERREGPDRTARADGEGRFRIERLRPASYTFAHVARRGPLEATVFSARVLVPEGTYSFDLTPNRGPGILRLRITRGGAPLELMPVSVSEWPFSGGPALLIPQHGCAWGGFVQNGRCELRGLLPDSYLCMLGGLRRIEVGADTPAELVVDLGQ